MKIKICGVTRAQDARLAAKLGAWAVGMIFVRGTPRYLSLKAALLVRASIPKGVLAVGVFRRPKTAELKRVIEALRLDAVQFDGRSKAIKILATGKRLPLVEPPRSDADRRAGRIPSEAARRAAWKKAKRRGRVVLAGGLTPDTVAEAVRLAAPWAVDVSSGVERQRGRKDAELLKRFFRAAAQ